MRDGPFLDDWMLHIYADMLDDFERTRCANENRIRTLTTASDVADKDGICRGHGLTDDHPDVAVLVSMVERQKQFEHESVLNLSKRVRKHPLWHVFADERGIGEKQLARLLAVVGDPAWHDQLNQPRTYRQLKAYVGLHVIEHHPGDNSRLDGNTTGVVGVAPKRQRGQKSNWNEDARKRLWLIAESLIRQNMGKMAERPGRSKYGEVYEKARFSQYGEAVHQTACVRCGPSGKPAPVGSPLSDGHKKACALRKVMDAVLKDLWREAYRLHNE